MRLGGSPRLLLSFTPFPFLFPSAHSAQSVQHPALRHGLLGRGSAVPSIFCVSATQKASTSTRRPVAPQRSHRPSQALLASDEVSHNAGSLSAASCSSVSWASAQGPPRLAPAVAAALAQRACESVLRQERCAADLLYFMSAEGEARRRRFFANSAPPLPSPLQLPEGGGTNEGLPAAMELPTRREDPTEASVFAASLSWADLDVRLAVRSTFGPPCVSPTSSRKDDSPSAWRTSVIARIDGEGDDSRATPPLSKPQQELFDLRRRLAYLLASESTCAGASTENGMPLLRSNGRRAALALSLTHSIFKVCTESACAAAAANNSEETVTRATQGNARRRSELERHRLMPCGGACSTSSAAGESSSSLPRLLQPARQDHWPYVYRSLAQPVELAPAEAYALLMWCADQVRAYASAVALAANRKGDPEFPSAVCDTGAATASAPHCAETGDLGVLAPSVASATVLSSSGKQSGGEGEERGRGRERQTLRKTGDSGLPCWPASATRSPSPLSTLRCLPRDRISTAVARRDNTFPPSFGRVDIELAEEAVSCATALMDLAATFARMAAESALPTADAFSDPPHEGAAQGAHIPATAKLCGADGLGEEDDVVESGEVLLGRVVGDVVLAVCDALHAVHDSELLGTCVGRLSADHGHATSSGREEQPLAYAAATLCQQKRQLRILHRRLSFSPPVLQSVLCCERESWSRALRLMERMAAWNVILSESLGVDPLAMTASSASLRLGPLSPFPPAAVDDDDTASLDVTSPAPVAALRSLSTDTIHMLLYILAQHGRLAEVLRLCEVVCGVRAFRLLRDCFAVGECIADADADVDAVLELIAHVAGPAASAAIGHCDSMAALHAAVWDRLRCVERVVRAGVVPQRVLSITEYALLLRRVLGDRIGGDAVRHAAAGTPARSGGPCSDVGWWLSPSQLWRFSAGLTRHMRAALCLIGFQVNMRHGQADMLNLEDLYVVLTISRQLMCRHGAELRQLQVRQLKSVDDNDGVDGDVGSDSSMHQRTQWVTWGVVSGSPLATSLKLPASWSDAPSKASLQCAPGLPLHLLPTRRRAGSLASTHHIQQLCAAFSATLFRVMPGSSSACTESGAAAPQTTASARLPPRAATANRSTTSRAVAVSAVLLCLVSQEVLSVLRAARYTRHIALFWDSALSALAVQQLQGYALGACAAVVASRGGGLPERTALASPVIRRVGDRMKEAAADCVREEVANALALQAEAAVGESLVAARRLVAPLPILAPYLSAYTVAALVQRPFRRAFTWQQCLALLPYTPLGSRSQLWLVQRIAQDSEGRRRAFPEAAGVPVAGLSAAPLPRTSLTLSALSMTALETAMRMVAIHSAPRRYQHRQGNQAGASLRATPNEAKRVVWRSLAAPLLGKEPAARVRIDSPAHADRALLVLLLEGNWARALQAFARAPSRVQVGGAPHVVRLLVEADVWRDLDDAQRRLLVRLAVQSSAHSGGGASGLLEEVLKTTLELGLWHTGLYFHQSVAAEQPELVRQCRRAQRYAAQLCRGLLERTSMTKTVAHMAKAARRGQWAEAAACFLRYASQRHDGITLANRSPTPVLSSCDSPRDAESDDAATLNTAPACTAGERTAPPHTASTTAVPPTATEELESLAALLNSAETRAPQLPTAARAAAPSPSLALLFSGDSALIPAELAHVAQTARYAMLHTPALWTHALRWLPTTALPLPFNHEQAWRTLCAANAAKLRALLPPLSQRGAMVAEGGTPAQSEESTMALVASTTEAALSLVEAARRAHRPRHANEAAMEQQVAVANALQVLHRAGAWEEATLLYDKAVEARCMPYASSSTVLAAALQGGAPWQVTLMYFFRMSQWQRPDVNATAVALQACLEGGQWEAAFRVLRQSVLTQAAPVPRLVMLAVNTALACGVWSRALAAAHRYRHTRNSQLAHTVLLTYVRTQHWDDATEYFYDCTRRGLRPLDASLELAIIASEAASSEYRKTALMVGAIASALEDLYRMSGAVLEHIIFVQRHAQRGTALCEGPPDSPCGASESLLGGAADIHDNGEYLPQPGQRFLKGRVQRRW
ncbi:hypothetical protein LSCM4_04475 [Leishmania orientalis]|uniref:Uncharacterized protein n=1 Tax=Leishmania orientalis TaxID=2249476 RepID=A0A836H0L2_9TRYP|nr:hypothetical protein LSCM4_04475 [Leishmania orientalis]